MVPQCAGVQPVAVDCGVQVLAVQQVASPPESCLFLDSPAMGASGGEEGAGAGALFLHVGAHPSATLPAAKACQNG